MRWLVLFLLMSSVCQAQDYLQVGDLYFDQDAVCCKLGFQDLPDLIQLKVRLVWQKENLLTGELHTFRESKFCYYSPKEQVQVWDRCVVSGMERIRVSVYLQFDKQRARLIKVLEA